MRKKKKKKKSKMRKLQKELHYESNTFVPYQIFYQDGEAITDSIPLEATMFMRFYDGSMDAKFEEQFKMMMRQHMLSPETPALTWEEYRNAELIDEEEVKNNA